MRRNLICIFFHRGRIKVVEPRSGAISSVVWVIVTSLRIRPSVLAAVPLLRESRSWEAAPSRISRGGATE